MSEAERLSAEKHALRAEIHVLNRELLRVGAKNRASHGLKARIGVISRRLGEIKAWFRDNPQPNHGPVTAPDPNSRQSKKRAETTGRAAAGVAFQIARLTEELLYDGDRDEELIEQEIFDALERLDKIRPGWRSPVSEPAADIEERASG